MTPSSSTLHLYNTLSRRVEPFSPLVANRPTLYLCGPTVYNYVHIGNARGPVVFGVLAALLRRRFGGLRYARNITDVDDKINAAAKELGTPISAITDKYAAAYREDMAALGVSGDFAPDIEPAATAHMPQMIAMIERLIADGHAYAAEGHVLFEVASFEGYGRLSGNSLEEIIAGARVEIAPYKRAPGDFVLWKPSTDDLPGWDSPWGRGRPGWHIECSAMAEAHLGPTIDIHAGGVDLKFPHHEDEIAQSECAHGGAPFARWWLHNGMLNFDGAKMAKSVGNIQRVHELVKAHPPEALRYALLSAHYRQPLEWSDGLIEQSVRTLDRLYGTLRDLGDIEAEAAIPASIEAALDDDLNTPAALAELSRIAGELRKRAQAIRKASEVRIGLQQEISESDTRAQLKFLALVGINLPDNVHKDPSANATWLKVELDSWLDNNAAKPVISAMKAELLGAGLALGLLQQDPQAWFGAFSDRIQALIDERTEAKKSRDFARADAIRQQLADEGILLEDTPQGVRPRRA